ncbi:MAG: hypothetical protein B6I38_00820 [Anaerolineaceae bacterium 4572_5.1]|nr:MAG: hypothetical protein B6I38_00820 [Anaerolineaceae bacterium 4572_5.1]RLD09288.1 MAG: hypothetical protein DRI56_04460 [Chloroflexota bacterium]
MTLPNLVGCGAGKSGTTSLYYYLSEHPEINMALAKEIHFFSWHYDRGIEWYEKQFPAQDDARIVGEFSTSYMLDHTVPRRMSELIPDARLLFIFRNPIDRAYSNYWSALNIGAQVSGSTFSEVIRTQEGYEKYIVGGLYYEHLQRYLKYYDRDHFFIMLTEEMKNDPIGQLSSCYKFLGVDASFQPNVEKNYNITITTDKKWKATLDQGWLDFKAVIKPMFLWIPGSFRRRFAQLEQKARISFNGAMRPEMLKDDREYLSNIYREHNEKLAQFMNRELSWD